MKETLKAIKEYEKTAKMLAHALVENRKHISETMRKERLEKRISLRRMATRLGISPAYLSDIELGRRNISKTFYDKLKKL